MPLKRTIIPTQNQPLKFHMFCYIILLSSILLSEEIIASEIASSAECDILGICIVSM